MKKQKNEKIYYKETRGILTIWGMIDKIQISNAGCTKKERKES